MRTHLTVLCFVALALLPGTASSADAKRPNILFADAPHHGLMCLKSDGPFHFGNCATHDHRSPQPSL